jgi:hypothetical protein
MNGPGRLACWSICDQLISRKHSDQSFRTLKSDILRSRKEANVSFHELPANSKVKVVRTGPPPEDVTFIKDLHINPRTRKQLIQGFWKGQRSISGRVAFVANESDRDRLRKEGKLLVRISDLSAQHVDVVIPATEVLPA